MDRYGAAFADGVQVQENGGKLASDKAGWLALQGRRCQSQQASLRSVNESFDGVLVMDDVSEPCAVKPHAIWECCSYARAALYQLDPAGHSIVAVRILVNAPGYWRSDRR